MSRAYRIRVRESIQVRDHQKRTVRAEDQVSSQLELLEILPRQQMAELLRAELLRRGFAEKGTSLVRHDKGVTVTVEPEAGTITVEAEACEQMQVEGEKSRDVIEPSARTRKQVQDELRQELQKDLDKQVKQKAAQLQSKVTGKLEGRLGDLRQELNQAVNRVTAEALKRKAAQMGQIKEMTEDPQKGSLTIVLEV
jgi:hypothetical protein